jgi:HK97 family phage prohead protease
MAEKKSFVLSDETVNTYGFRVLMDGADIEQFKRNPVMFYNHDDWSMPIGRWDNVRIEDGKLLADPVFDTEDENARKIAGKVERGFLRMASVGFRVVETSDDPMKMLPGQKLPTVTRWQLREASIVGIGANHNALRLYDENDQPLTDDQILKLFDNNFVASENKPQTSKQSKMKGEIFKMLDLPENSTDEQLHDAVKTLVDKMKEVSEENKRLKDEADARAKADAEARNIEAVRLVDEAVKDGRLNAEGKENFLKFFATDFESAQKALSNIPKRASVKSMLDAQAQDTNKELADMASKTWDELDKAGKLVTLKEKYIDLYEEKFEQKYGKKPVKK